MNQLEVKVSRLEQAIKALEASNAALTNRVAILESSRSEQDASQAAVVAKPVSSTKQWK